MAFISFIRKIFFIFLFNVILQVRAQSQIPACKDSFPSSLLQNNSFEEYSGCSSEGGGGREGGLIDYYPSVGGITINNWHTQVRDWPVNYFNYNCRTNKQGSVFDTTNFMINSPCDYFYPRVPLSLPDGEGFIGITEDDQTQFIPETKIEKTYLTYCLSQPLYAGLSYVFSFYFGFGTKGIKCNLGSDLRSQSPYGIAIFGRKDCPDYPSTDPQGKEGCLSDDTNWVQLGNITLSGENEWIESAIEFTPQTDISCIAIGPDCANHTLDKDFYYTISMHFMDKFILAPKADFSFKTITAVSGNACTGHFVLQAPANGKGYKWYKDGLLIPNANAQTYIVPDKADAAGSYVANISLPYNNCRNTLPFLVTFSDINNFSLGNDTTLCAPAEITLNASWKTAANYFWQDGSVNPQLQVNKSGLYWAEVTDNNGCSKRDSINITIKGCDECKLFIPSAFTPNNDGLNDVFKAVPDCANIGLANFSMLIYNRWGELVFKTNDINKGWDGMYKSQYLNQGTYIYLVNYSFKQNQPIQQRGTVILMR